MMIEYIESSTRMSRATIHNNTAYFCGQVPKDESADIKDMNDFQFMNEVWDAWVEPNFPPARTCVEAKMARPELLVEITITAALA
jgi:enamine deaminase RidA (YjgF/YER057c/UK114 family)